METLTQDLRYALRHALRGLARTPGFTAAVVVTLALGPRRFAISDVLAQGPGPQLQGGMTR